MPLKTVGVFICLYASRREHESVFLQVHGCKSERLSRIKTQTETVTEKDSDILTGIPAPAHTLDLTPTQM